MDKQNFEVGDKPPFLEQAIRLLGVNLTGIDILLALQGEIAINY
ncbi:MAG TPA: hypothetical protein PLO16_14235 [Acidocella sp.]|nr:hypothetical protein [Acidocella sp.]